MCPSKRCKCIKSDKLMEFYAGNIFKYRDCGPEKIIWLNETDISYTPLFCTEEYFNEHFEEMR